MIKIIAHRGLWSAKKEQNTLFAINNAFNLGYGVETDIWEYNNNIVINHDSPNIDSKDFKSIIHDNTGLLALNVKSSIKPSLLASKLASVESYFIFDCAVPDALKYIKQGLNVYTRVSEYEQFPSFYKEAKGIWIDMFNSDWITLYDIDQYKQDNKEICIVSPELHGRDHLVFWKRLKEWNIDNISICTDYPNQLREYLNA